MDKRDMIERAFESYLEQLDWSAFGLETVEFFDALADQAIAIECEVEHDKGWPGVKAYTSIKFPSADEYRDWLSYSPQDFPEGKALAIIIPLEEE